METQQTTILCQEILTWKSDRICNFEDCSKGACYNYIGDKRRRFCFTHKLENMVNIASKRCEHDGCDKIPTYKIKGEKANKYCKDHKLSGMIDRHKKCEYMNCENRSHYNYKEMTTPKFCVEHKLNDMICVGTKTCETEDCRTRPAYNYITEKNPIYCSQHKKENMINIVSKVCEYESCKILATFNTKGNKTHRFCKEHKEEGMINNTCKRCEFDGCEKIPLYNFEGLNKRFCKTHKLENMVDIVSKRCHFEGCKIRPTYNFMDKSNGLYCLSHKLQGMVDVKHPTCKTHLCGIRVQPKYDGYCLRCYIYTFPDKPIVQNYKTKECTVVEYVKTTFPHVTWSTDKRVQDGCSKRRPDMLLDLGHQVIIVEVDENQHSDYDCSCENRRIMELSQDVQHRPIVFIRFNPDDYINSKKDKVKSCWAVTKETGIIRVCAKKEWNNRLLHLKQQIDYWCENKTDKMLEIVQLFYDEPAY